MNKEILVKKVNSLYEEYKLYNKHFEEDRKTVESKKEEIVKSLEDGKEFDSFESEMEFLLLGAQMKVQDINQITLELVTLYKLAVAYELSEEFSEELNNLLVKLTENSKKLSYIPTEKNLKERVEGVQKEKIEEIKNHSYYKQVREQLRHKLV